MWQSRRSLNIMSLLPSLSIAMIIGGPQNITNWLLCHRQWGIDSWVVLASGGFAQARQQGMAVNDCQLPGMAIAATSCRSVLTCCGGCADQARQATRNWLLSDLCWLWREGGFFLVGVGGFGGMMFIQTHYATMVPSNNPLQFFTLLFSTGAGYSCQWLIRWGQPQSVRNVPPTKQKLVAKRNKTRRNNSTPGEKFDVLKKRNSGLWGRQTMRTTIVIVAIK